MSANLTAALREASNLTLSALLPVFAVAAAVALIVGLLCASLGIRDSSLAQITRALAVVLALAALCEQGAHALVEFAHTSWSSPGGAHGP